ncbi:MAG: AMP-binding protein, partial [Prevotellaceae bacterium]|nr:AMP-binding protein [Prevotellaceae bacterium]
PIISKRSIGLALSVPILNSKIYEQINHKISESFGGIFEEVVVGGAALNREVEEFFQKIKFPLTVGYGMTECGPLISYRWWEEFVPGSVGKVLPKIMEAKIDKPNAEGIGEVLVRGENVMLGYYKNKEITDEVIDKDGWLHTGDLGTIDADNNIFLRGRNKTMILSASGQNIYPEEIEAKLNNMPFVMESLIVEHNKKLVALVYPDYDSVDGGVVSRYDLDAIMEENLKNLNGMVASYETVSKIKLYPNEFEKTPKKSIKRYLYNQISD